MRRRWKNINEFEGYQVSDDGIVRSYINNRHGIGKTSHILKPTLNKHGYETVCLGRGNRRLIHRLVAKAFIPNPSNLPVVRHLGDNPRNNTCKNLAWGMQADNMQDCVKHGRLVGDTSYAIESKRVPIVAIPLNGDPPITFRSMNEAARKLNLWTQHISSVARGRLRQTGGYRFKYIDKDDVYD